MSETQAIPDGDPRVAGLTLNLLGRFDPHQLSQALGLNPLCMEFAATNSVLIFSGTKKPISYPVTRQITLDELKVKVGGPQPLEALFNRLFNAVESLSGESRAQWDSLEERTADLGLYWMNDSNCGTEFDLPRQVVARLAQFKIALRVSVYGHELAIKRAIEQQAQDRA